MSVKILVRTIATQEYRVNFFPINRKLIIIGARFNSRLTAEYGTEK